jgi:competence protein ComEA
MTTQSAALTVHVSGSVVRPGLVTVGEGARAADAIAAAGGATPEADLGALNLAEPVFDGTRLHVPKLGQTEVVPATGTEADGLISINRATATELQDLPGVGPVLAQRIIDHRDDIGGFSAVEDLLDVPGIGERILAGMRDLIVVP